MITCYPISRTVHTLEVEHYLLVEKHHSWMDRIINITKIWLFKMYNFPALWLNEMLEYLHIQQQNPNFSLDFLPSMFESRDTGKFRKALPCDLLGAIPFRHQSISAPIFPITFTLI